MHPTTEHLLQELSKTSDNNDLSPAQCWCAIGGAVNDWRQAGKPDLPDSPPQKCLRCGHLIIEDECLCQAWKGLDPMPV